MACSSGVKRDLEDNNNIREILKYVWWVLSQTKYIWSLAAVDADVDDARYDMVAQCGAGGQPKLDLITIHTRL